VPGPALPGRYSSPIDAPVTVRSEQCTGSDLNSIAILAPCVYRKRPVDDAEGNDSPELGRILRGFRVAYVWDESQTDGEPLADVSIAVTTDGPQHAVRYYAPTTRKPC